MRRTLGRSPGIFALSKAGSMEANPTTFASRSSTFAAAAKQLGGAVLLVRRADDGLHSYLLLPNASTAARTAAVHLAQAVGAEAKEEPGLELFDAPDQVWADQVAWARINANTPPSRDSRVGADPAELSRVLARSMSKGMWCAIMLREKTRAERHSYLPWLTHRMRTASPVHHSVGSDSVVMSVAAGGDDPGRLSGFLAGVVAALPGFDLDTRIRTSSVKKVNRIRIGSSALLALVGVALVSGIGWGVSQLGISDPEMFTLLLSAGKLAGLAAGVAAVVCLAMFVLSTWRGASFTFTERLADGTESGAWPLPPTKVLPVRRPRNASRKTVDGVERETGESTGDYPFHSYSACVGPEVVCGLVAPHSGALHAEDSGRSRPTPPTFLSEIGPVIGRSADGEVHLPMAEAYNGLATTGAVGTGKSKLINMLWAYDCAERVYPTQRPGTVGASNTLVYFDTKGDEVSALREWAGVIGDRMDLVDVGDPDSLSIDLFAGQGSATARAETFMNMMIYALPPGSIMGASQEVATAVLTGALALTPELVERADCGLARGANPVELAHCLNGGFGDEAGRNLFEAINGEAVRLQSKGDTSTHATDLMDAARQLRVFYNATESQRRTQMAAFRNKTRKLLTVPGWWSSKRPSVSWEEIITGHRNVVINLGTSATGQLLDDEAKEMLSGMLFFSLRLTVQRMCGGWQKAGRAVSVFSDELAQIASYSEGQFDWLKDVGRSYGVRLRFATQRPAQLADKVRQVFLTMGVLVSLRQDEMAAASAVADQLGMRPGDWSAEDVLALGAFEAAVRATVAAKRQPGFTMKVPFFEEDRSLWLARWGFDIQAKHPAELPPTPDSPTLPQGGGWGMAAASPAQDVRLPSWAVDDDDLI